jgi:hypothetical protein
MSQGEGMGNGERALYYLGGLVAAFVLAYLAGTLVGPALDLGLPAETPSHEMTR